MTYAELLMELQNLNAEQLQCSVTVEIIDRAYDECYSATFRICDTEHDTLDNDHPVIFVEQ